MQRQGRRNLPDKAIGVLMTVDNRHTDDRPRRPKVVFRFRKGFFSQRNDQRFVSFAGRAALFHDLDKQCVDDLGFASAIINVKRKLVQLEHFVPLFAVADRDPRLVKQAAPLLHQAFAFYLRQRYPGYKVVHISDTTTSHKRHLQAAGIRPGWCYPVEEYLGIVQESLEKNQTRKRPN